MHKIFVVPFVPFCGYNLIIRALLSRLMSPLSALRVSTISGASEHTRL
jgi:hypothetical protein